MMTHHQCQLHNWKGGDVGKTCVGNDVSDGPKQVEVHFVIGIFVYAKQVFIGEVTFDGLWKVIFTYNIEDESEVLFHWRDGAFDNKGYE